MGFGRGARAGPARGRPGGASDERSGPPSLRSAASSGRDRRRHRATGARPSPPAAQHRHRGGPRSGRAPLAGPDAAGRPGPRRRAEAAAALRHDHLRPRQPGAGPLGAATDLRRVRRHDGARLRRARPRSAGRGRSGRARLRRLLPCDRLPRYRSGAVKAGSGRLTLARKPAGAGKSRRDRSGVRTGLEVLARLRPKWLRGRNVGLLMHPASVTSSYLPARQIIADLCGGNLRALFGPQHGFAGEKQDNMIESGHGRDGDLDIPVYSLYSETRSPTRAMLQGIDLLLVDLQDVGTRVYTFAWTTALALEACAEAGCEVVVLDRPNPIGGGTPAGDLIRPRDTPFLRPYPLPQRPSPTPRPLAALGDTPLSGGEGKEPGTGTR